MIAELLAGTTRLLAPAPAEKKANPVLPAIIRDATTVSGSGGVAPEDQDFEAYLKTPGKFSWVSSCVDAIATAGASCDLKLMRRGRDGQEEEVPNHPLLDLFYDPNPEQGYFSFWYGLLQQIGYTGECYISSDAPFSARTGELWGLRADRMEPVPVKSEKRDGKEENPIAYWKYASQTGVTIRLDTDEVIQVRRPHPTDAFRGLSPIKQLEPLLRLEYRALNWNASYFRNGASAPFIITRENAPTQPEIDRHMEMFKARYQGSDNAMRPMFLWGKDAKVTVLSDGPKSASFMELLSWIRDATLSVYNCPPFAVGLPDGTTWSNSREQKSFFYQNAVIPANKLITDTLNASLLVEAFGSDLFFAHDYSGVSALRPDEAAQAATDQIHVNTGLRTINEIRQDREFGDDVEWGDEPKAPMPAFSLSMPPAEAKAAQPQRPRPTPRDVAGVSCCGTREALALSVEAAKASGDRKRVAWADAVERMSERWPKWERALKALWETMEAEALERVAAKERTGLTMRGGGGSRRDDRKAESVGAVVPPGWAAEDWFDAVAAARAWEAELLALASDDLATGAAGVSPLIEAAGFAPAFDIEAPAVQEFLRSHVGQRVTKMLQTDKDLISELVAAASEENAPVSELAARIQDHFAFNRKYRSVRIAQTEVTALYGEGSLQSMESAGLERHTWQTSGLENVREAHREINQTTVGLREDFFMTDPKTGAVASGPGPGRMGAAWADVNCACITIPAL